MPIRPAVVPGLAAAILLALSTAAPADDTTAVRLGGDLFAAGDSAVFAGGPGDPVDDLFLAGQDVWVSGGIDGSAHLAGRKVAVTAPVGGDVYAAGMDVSLPAGIGGDATLAGYDVAVAAVAGDLRAAARKLRLTGGVGGYAGIAAQEVVIDAPIAGDVRLAAQTVHFGQAARVDGILTIEAPAADLAGIEVPERVAPADRVRRRETAPLPTTLVDPVRAVPGVAGGGVLAALLRLGLAIGAITLAATLLPARFAAMAAALRGRPAAMTGAGTLALATLIGLVVVAALTVIGLLIVPILLLAVPLAWIAGQLVGTYALGVALAAALGLPPPRLAGQTARAAALGAVVLAVLGLVPVLGWGLRLLVTLAGIGALAGQMRGARGAPGA